MMKNCTAFRLQFSFAMFVFKVQCIFCSILIKLALLFFCRQNIPLSYVYNKGIMIGYIITIFILSPFILLHTLPWIPHGQCFPYKKKIWVIRSCLSIDGLLYDTNLSNNMNTCFFLTLWMKICNLPKTKVWFFQTGNKICDKNINLLFEFLDLCHLQLY